MVCWNPCRYSCSSAGTISCLRFHLEASNLSKAGGGGSLHSGKKTIKDSGSKLSSKSFSKCTMVASISSSQKGGLASNDPQWGRNSRIDLRVMSRIKTYANHVDFQLTLLIRSMSQCQERQSNTGGNSNWAVKQNIQRSHRNFCVDIQEQWQAGHLGWEPLRQDLSRKSLGNVWPASTHVSKSARICGHLHSHSDRVAPKKSKHKLWEDVLKGSWNGPKRGLERVLKGS